MPTDNESINPIALRTGTLFITDPDTGDKTPLGPIEPTAIEIDAAPLDTPIVRKLDTNLEATFTIRIPGKKMNRKKFVKKLMANRVPRNVANSMAEIARAHGHSYSWSWLVINFSRFLP